MKDPINIEALLPYGEALRALLSQSYLSEGDLRYLLQSKGIFVHNPEKKTTIPILTASLLSPSEFDVLRDCQNTREDNEKVRSCLLDWEWRGNFLDALPSSFDVSSIAASEYDNFKIKNVVNFYPIKDENGNGVLMGYTIERSDKSRNWSDSKSIFRGELAIYEATGAIKIRSIHTAKDTKDINSKLISALTSHFKANGAVLPNSAARRVLFSAFNNQERIRFFLRLAGHNSAGALTFDSITDFEFKPDEKLPLPENSDIKWMEKKVNDIRVTGTSLQDTALLKVEDYYPYLIFWSIEAKYRFDYHGAQGNCRVSFDFPNFLKTQEKELELEVNIPYLSMDPNFRHVNKEKVKKYILSKIDNYKLECYRDHLAVADSSKKGVSPVHAVNP